VKRHGFTRLKDSIGRLHTEFSDEHPSTLKIEEHPKRGHEMYYTSNRDKFGKAIVRNRLCEAHSDPSISRVGFRNQDFPLRRLMPTR
jgi:hypothetical protein